MKRKKKPMELHWLASLSCHFRQPLLPLGLFPHL